MNWYKTAKKDSCKGWLAVEIDSINANKIKKWGKKYISDDILYDKKGHGREDDIHITLIYGLCIDDPTIIKKIIEKEKPIKAKLKRIGFFKNNPDFDVVIVKIESKDLENLNKKINKFLNVESTYSEYKPHCTIAYVKKGEAAKYAGDTIFNDVNLTFNKIVFINNKNEESNMSLGK